MSKLKPKYQPAEIELFMRFRCRECGEWTMADFRPDEISHEEHECGLCGTHGQIEAYVFDSTCDHCGYEHSRGIELTSW